MNVRFCASVALLALTVAGCSSGPTPAQTQALAAAELRAAMQVEVRYEAEGDPLTYDPKGTYGSVTMKTPTGTSQSDPDLPMGVKDSASPGLTMTFQAGDFVYLSVQNNGSTDNVRCRITASNGVVLSENSSTSSYGIATCQGRAR